MLNRWKTQFWEGLPEIFAPGQPAEQKRLRDHIAELERLAGNPYLLSYCRKFFTIPQIGAESSEKSLRLICFDVGLNLL